MTKNKKNKLIPRKDANENSINHAKLIKHKSEVIQKKIEQMLQEQREKRMKVNADTSSKTI